LKGESNNLTLKQYRIVIEKDELNRVFVAYDINSENEIMKHTECILKEVNTEIADEMHKYFDVDLISYGVKIFDENIEFMKQS